MSVIELNWNWINQKCTMPVNELVLHFFFFYRWWVRLDAFYMNETMVVLYAKIAYFCCFVKGGVRLGGSLQTSPSLGLRAIMATWLRTTTQSLILRSSCPLIWLHFLTGHVKKCNFKLSMNTCFMIQYWLWGCLLFTILRFTIYLGQFYI